MTQGIVQRRFSKLAAAINQKAVRLGLSRITPDDLALVYMESSGFCAYCGAGVDPMGVSFDHVIPFARGGQNTRRNLVASCITCQRTKFTKTPEEHAQARVLLVPCEVCKTPFKPRWADYQRGYGRTCSRKCSGTKGGQMERGMTLTGETLTA